MSRWRPPAPAPSPYITRAGYERLEMEMASAWTRRAEVVRHLATAAAEGDRSENAEYLYRKKELAGIDRRIRYLQRRLPRLKVVDGRPAQTGEVYFGAWVELQDAHGAEVRYRIVGADELDRAPGHISVDSPLARALLKRQIDDDVRVRTEQGEIRYSIVAIDYGGD
jgi:transcription elongation factor GreB